jgi:hypothetical protein
LKAFREFGKLIGSVAEAGTVVEASGRRGIPLYIGWVTSEPANCADLEVSGRDDR